VALLIGVLWQINRQPDQPATPVPDSGTARPTPIATLAPATTPTPPPKKPGKNRFAASRIIFVPGDDGMLHQRTIREPATAVEMHTRDYDLVSKVAAERSLQLLFKRAPESFPPGTRVPSVQQEKNSDVIRVSFNKAFAQSDFWSSEARTELAIYAIVNTLAAGKNARVQLLIEGKPIQTLGEFDASDPFEPDKTLVAKS
jgi:hypothetical protein